jgi:hypothetical protein
VTLLDHTLILIELNWLVLAYNFNLREYVLINHESSLGGILLTALLHFYLVIILCISFVSCTF